MAKAKKKLLPKDFAELLAAGDLDALKAVFDSCDVNARGGYAKRTTLAFDACPDELARWLVDQGADLSAADSYGNTPLHARARSRLGRIDGLLALGADVHDDGASVGTPLHAAADSHHTANVRLLLAHGATVDAVNREGLTPLEIALRGCSNINLEDIAPLAEALLAAGARKTERMPGYIEEIGKNFEFHRAGFNPESVDAASAGLDRLYALFDARPVAARALHDGKSPIVADAGRWQDQHQQLWELLVPSSGAAATMQGEVVRIAGRIIDELERNGGVNWNADYRKMADAFLDHIATGDPLPPRQLSDAAAIIADAKRKSGDPRGLAELAVAWVRLNPAPIALDPPAYSR